MAPEPSVLRGTDRRPADGTRSGRTDRGLRDAIEAVRGGENVVLATETASGKSLAYTVPAFERALDRRATTLYIAPQVALINDQTETLSELAQGLGFASGVSVAQYTGRLSKSEKREVRKRMPTVLLSNPDMVHYALLPHAHRLWDWFFPRSRPSSSTRSTATAACSAATSRW